MGSTRRGAGLVAALLIAVSVALMIVVGMTGPSAAVPVMAKAAQKAHRLPDLLVSVMTWCVVLTGGAGALAGLRALRHGWRPAPRLLMLAGLVATLALVAVPPLASTDMLHYAIYGRITALGHSPYVMTPSDLARTHDPIGELAPSSWRHAPSVYGPLATALQAGASLLGGTSMIRTVLYLKILNGLAFLATAVLLDRITCSDARNRVRAHLLWTVNPLMLWAVVAGGHVDGVAVLPALAALAVLRRSPLASGVLVGLATAIKAPFVLVGAGIAWVLRDRRPALAVAGVAGAVVAGGAYLVPGYPAARALVRKGAGSTSVTSPWRPLTDALHLSSPRAFGAVSLLLGLGITALLLWRGPHDMARRSVLPAAWPAFALAAGWLMFSPNQHPWYDALLFPLLAVVAASRLDEWTVARATVGALGFVPGMPGKLSPPWVDQLVSHVVQTLVVPLTLDVLIVILVVWCWRGTWDDTASPLPQRRRHPALPGSGLSSATGRQGR